MTEPACPICGDIALCEHLKPPDHDRVEEQTHGTDEVRVVSSADAGVHRGNSALRPESYCRACGGPEYADKRHQKNDAPPPYCALCGNSTASASRDHSTPEEPLIKDIDLSRSWDQHVEGVRDAIAAQDRRTVQSEADARTIVVTNAPHPTPEAQDS